MRLNDFAGPPSDDYEVTDIGILYPVEEGKCIDTERMWYANGMVWSHSEVVAWAHVPAYGRRAT